MRIWSHKIGNKDCFDREPAEAIYSKWHIEGNRAACGESSATPSNQSRNRKSFFNPRMANRRLKWSLDVHLRGFSANGTRTGNGFGHPVTNKSHSSTTGWEWTADALSYNYSYRALIDQSMASILAQRRGGVARESWLVPRLGIDRLPWLGLLFRTWLGQIHQCIRLVNPIWRLLRRRMAEREAELASFS